MSLGRDTWSIFCWILDLRHWRWPERIGFHLMGAFSACYLIFGSVPFIVFALLALETTVILRMLAAGRKR